MHGAHPAAAAFRSPSYGTEQSWVTQKAPAAQGELIIPKLRILGQNQILPPGQAVQGGCVLRIFTPFSRSVWICVEQLMAGLDFFPPHPPRQRITARAATSRLRSASCFEPAACPGGQAGQWHPGLYQE